MFKTKLDSTISFFACHTGPPGSSRIGPEISALPEAEETTMWLQYDALNTNPRKKVHCTENVLYLPVAPHSCRIESRAVSQEVNNDAC